ncbi:M28 family peptidase [Alienimonas californiensis]|uniref:Leupeptin-inactivating enzyme 1 n=1 Tax=Alienimonas californiensis TaxID=2527989 RepID=A0A517P8P7_9PLAN|nr:M28 family peptidase [Alienimonas californiensis]QDT15748.1 Leupeptin-inactivating enzyme 1 precursor [Alienimonas californiensis]
MIVHVAALALLSTAAGGGGETGEAAGAGVARRFERRVVAVAAAEALDGRRDAIENELRALRLEPQRRPFAGPQREGTNLLAVVPPPAAGAAPERTLMLGAHLDRVEAGTGAVDNAGGCAAVLELLGRFQARPLTHHRVVGLWFDQEEQGLLGSRAFVEAAGDPAAPGAAAGLPDLFVNFDVFAYGDTLWAHHPSEDDRTAARNFVAGTAAAGGEPFPTVIGPLYPPSDHRPFAAVRETAEPGSPAAEMTVLSLSLLPREQIVETVAFLEAMEGGGRPTRAGLPKILALIHTANDTPSAVRPSEAAAAIDAVEAGLRALDAAAGAEAAPATDDETND